MAGLENRARTAKAKWDNIVKKTQEISIKAGTGVLSPSDIKSLGNAIRMQSNLASTLFDKAVERANTQAAALRPEIIEQIKKANAEVNEANVKELTEKVAGLLLAKELPKLIERLQKTINTEQANPLLKNAVTKITDLGKSVSKLPDTVADKILIKLQKTFASTLNVKDFERSNSPSRNVQAKMGAVNRSMAQRYDSIKNDVQSRIDFLTGADRDVRKNKNANLSDPRWARNKYYVAQFGLVGYNALARKNLRDNLREGKYGAAISNMWDMYKRQRTALWNKDARHYNTIHADEIRAGTRKAYEYRDRAISPIELMKGKHADKSLLPALGLRIKDLASDTTQKALLATSLKYAKARQAMAEASYKLRFETWDTLKKGASKVWNKTKQIASSVKDLLLDPATLLTLITGGTALINVVSGLTGSLDWKSMLWDAFKAIIPSPVVDFFSGIADKFKEIFGDDGKKEKEEKVTKENLNAYIASQETPIEQMGDTYGVEDLAAKGEALIAKRKAEEAAAEKRYNDRLASAKADAALAEKMRKENGGVVSLHGKEGAALADPYLLSETPEWNKKRWADAQARAEAGYQQNFVGAKKAYLDKGYVALNTPLKKQLADGFQTDANGVNTNIIPKGSIKADDLRGTQTWKNAGLDKLESVKKNPSSPANKAKADSTVIKPKSKSIKAGPRGAEGLKRAMHGDENTFRAKDIDNWKRAVLLNYRSDVSGPDKAVNALYQQAIADRKARWEAWKKQGGKGIFKKPRDDFFATNLLGRGTAPVDEYMQQHNIKMTTKGAFKEKPEVSGAVAKAKADTSKNGAKTLGQAISKPASGAIARPVTASSSKLAKQGKGGVGDMLNLNNTSANGARGDASLALLNAKTL